MNNQNTFKILSLDGGGSWAIIQLLTLHDRYGNIKGRELLRKFDLIIANSGGSIVLAALAEDYSLNEAIDLFRLKQNREQIFHKNTFKDRFFPTDYLRGLGLGFGPKYSSLKKKEAFEKLFPMVNNMQMDDLPSTIGKESLKIVVCTYDALNNRAKFFKSYSQSDSVKLTQAINGSSNAPLQYFDFPARFKAKKSEVFYELWDGALGGFNNPVLAGIIEAYKLGVKMESIKVVSLGTSNKLMSIDEKKQFWKWKQIAIKYRRKKLAFKKLKPQFKFFMATVFNQAKTILYQPPDTANYIAMIFLKANSGNTPSQNFVRLSPLIHFDSNSDEEIIQIINKLYALDMDLTKDSDVDLLFDCFENWKKGKIYNQPIDFEVKRNNDVLLIEGQKTYSDGIDQWSKWGF